MHILYVCVCNAYIIYTYIHIYIYIYVCCMYMSPASHYRCHGLGVCSLLLRWLLTAFDKRGHKPVSLPSTGRTTWHRIRQHIAQNQTDSVNGGMQYLHAWFQLLPTQHIFPSLLSSNNTLLNHYQHNTHLHLYHATPSAHAFAIRQQGLARTRCV